MKAPMLSGLALLILAVCTGTALAGGSHYQVEYPPSALPGELALGVTYTIWIPAGVKTVRGIIVHQHGCGSGACQGGATAAYDLHWQALARKWDCALLGPSYHQEDSQNCRLWCDPRNGSYKAFLRAVDELAEKSNHPEPAKAEEAVWLPNRRVAEAWAEYVKTGVVGDRTPPPAPFDVKVSANPGRGAEVTWDAEADLESGIKAFVIIRDGVKLGQLPEKPVGKFGRPLFQAMSYHDTPEKPLPEMRFVDASSEAGSKHEYRIVAVNSVELDSEPSPPASIR